MARDHRVMSYKIASQSDQMGEPRSSSPPISITGSSNYPENPVENMEGGGGGKNLKLFYYHHCIAHQVFMLYIEISSWLPYVLEIWLVNRNGEGNMLQNFSY